MFSETDSSKGRFTVFSGLETLDSLVKFDGEEGIVVNKETIRALLQTFPFDDLVSLLENEESGETLKNSTVGALALTSISNFPSERLEQFVMNSAEWLILSIEENNELRHHSLEILSKALDSQRIYIKRRLLEGKIMGSLVPLMRHSDASIRLSTAMVCAGLYNHCRRGCAEFIELHGEQLLVQLIKRDGDTDNPLALLLECVLDLLYVKAI